MEAWEKPIDPTNAGGGKLMHPGQYLVRCISWKGGTNYNGDKLNIYVTFEVVDDRTEGRDENVRQETIGTIHGETFWLTNETTMRMAETLFARLRVDGKSALVKRVRDHGTIDEMYAFQKPYLNKLKGGVMVVVINSRDYNGEPQLQFGFAMNHCNDSDWDTYAKGAAIVSDMPAPAQPPHNPSPQSPIDGPPPGHPADAQIDYTDDPLLGDDDIPF